MKTELFKTISNLADEFVDLGMITDDGDRDETDARIWAAINTLREELQNAHFTELTANYARKVEGGAE